MKKIIVLILLLIVVTGCEAKYSIEIIGGEYRETLEVSNQDKESWGSGEESYQYMIKANAKAYIPTDYREVENYDEPIIRPEVNYYSIKLIETASNLGLKYSNIFNNTNYGYSNLVLSHFEHFQMKSSKGVITISSGKQNEAFSINPYLEKLTVEVRTNHEVIEHNAEAVIDNKYYWYFSATNYANKEIIFKISEEYNSQLDLWQTDEKGYFGRNTLIAVYGLIGLALLVGAIIVYFKVKNSNPL